MLSRRIVIGVIAVAAMGAGAARLLSARSNERVARIDFDQVVRATTPAFDAAVAPVDPAPIKEFRIPIKDATLQIADGVSYAGWTFGGTVPGPVMRVRVGDEVRVHVVNESGMVHSIDFHAAQIPWNIAYRPINPHDSISFTFSPRYAGVFMVHCGTPPVTMHIMQGMYMAIIVDPRDGWPTKANQEFVVVQSEFYTQPGNPTKVDGAVMAPMGPDWQAAMAKNASYVVFNGRALQYKDHPLTVNEGDRVRFFVVNAGPSLNSDFHIVGAIFDRIYPDAETDRPLEGVQTYTVPAGGGAVFEAVFAKGLSGAGLYPFVTHSFADAEKGAMGLVHVVAPATVATR